jgi:hypothetical protein
MRSTDQFRSHGEYTGTAPDCMRRTCVTVLAPISHLIQSLSFLPLFVQPCLLSSGLQVSVAQPHALSGRVHRLCNT